ncbi:diacylglycerol/lipid kinase family protein [Bacillus sp. FJAT-27986]|uniref:diacylglycerol/lipid kinase family protein n=1 Tax=Bacillus sp. FJAT-27986 TaxID=1743146 RepID=UPI00098101C3|nr:diacylglycerol kinase family protein [Bacillus sp. FJAT-27986]
MIERAVYREALMSKEKFNFIINPAAKNRGSLKIWKKVKKYLERENIHYQYRYTEYEGHACKITREILEKESDSLIIAVGGDGTIHEVINGAVGYKEARISYIPAGSGNDFSRGYQIDKNPTKAFKKLCLNSEKMTPIDLGSYKTDKQGYFMNSLGMGLDAAVTKAVNESKSKYYFNKIGAGKLVYLYFFFIKWLTYRPIDVSLSIDGRDLNYKNVWLVTTSNQPYFGGGIKISPNSKPDDGLFHIIIVHNISKWKLILMFVTVVWGGHLKIRGVQELQGKNIKLSSGQPAFIHADGDYIGNDKVVVNMHHHKVNIAALGE